MSHWHDTAPHRDGAEKRNSVTLWRAHKMEQDDGSRCQQQLANKTATGVTMQAMSRDLMTPIWP